MTDRIRKLKLKELLKQLDLLSDDIFLRDDHMISSDRPNKQFCKGKFASVDELTFAQFFPYYPKNVWSRQQHNVSCDYQPDILEDRSVVLLNFKSSLPKRFPLMNTKELFPLRKEPTVIRYHKFKFLEENENFYHHLLMLYFPWRKEVDLMWPNDSYEQNFFCLESLILF